jgi:hypothetical protein
VPTARLAPTVSLMPIFFFCGIAFGKDACRRAMLLARIKEKHNSSFEIRWKKCGYPFPERKGLKEQKQPLRKKGPAKTIVRPARPSFSPQHTPREQPSKPILIYDQIAVKRCSNLSSSWPLVVSSAAKVASAKTPPKVPGLAMITPPFVSIQGLCVCP